MTSSTPKSASQIISKWRLVWLEALLVRASLLWRTFRSQLILPASADADQWARGPSPLAGANLLRPTVSRRGLPAVSALATSSARNNSNVPTEDPKKKAQSLIDALPGSSLLSKTAILSSTAGLSVYAISSEYYVVNEETVVAFCLLAVWGALIKFGGPAYKEWAEGQSNKIKNILNQARADHSAAVQTRIDDVKQLSGVVDVTKSLFEVSKVRRPLSTQMSMIRDETDWIRGRMGAWVHGRVDAWKARFEAFEISLG